MRKVIDCPRCEDEPLVVRRDSAWQRIICFECGWSYTFIPPIPEDELHAAIVAVVDAWKDVAQIEGADNA